MRNTLALINENKQEDKSDWYQFCTGKLLRSVFKDFLIFDDIYEFLGEYQDEMETRDFIKKYANEQRYTAVAKYGFKGKMDILAHD